MATADKCAASLVASSLAEKIVRPNSVTIPRERREATDNSPADISAECMGQIAKKGDYRPNAAKLLCTGARAISLQELNVASSSARASKSPLWISRILFITSID